MKRTVKRPLCLILVLVMLITAACSRSDANGTAVSDTQRGDRPESRNNGSEDKDMNGSDNSKYRVGSEVSDAYVDPSTIVTVPEDQIKAKGYSYD